MLLHICHYARVLTVPSAAQDVGAGKPAPAGNNSTLAWVLSEFTAQTVAGAHALFQVRVHSPCSKHAASHAMPWRQQEPQEVGHSGLARERGVGAARRLSARRTRCGRRC